MIAPVGDTGLQGEGIEGRSTGTQSRVALAVRVMLMSPQGPRRQHPRPIQNENRPEIGRANKRVHDPLTAITQHASKTDKKNMTAMAPAPMTQRYSSRRHAARPISTPQRYRASSVVTAYHNTSGIRLDDTSLRVRTSLRW